MENDDDREVVLAACIQTGRALRFASAALKDDREVVLAACNQNGCALHFASVALKGDREVVLAGSSTEEKRLQRTG
jgi:hypothetical protein